MWMARSRHPKEREACGQGLGSPTLSTPFLGEPFWARHLIQLRFALAVNSTGLLAGLREKRCVMTSKTFPRPLPQRPEFGTLFTAPSFHLLSAWGGGGFVPPPPPTPAQGGRPGGPGRR